MERIRERMLKLAMIGEDPDGGISRVFGSAALEKGRRAAAVYMEEAGLAVWEDPAGNLHGIYGGNASDDRKNPPGAVYLGSHLDTVKQGGVFDGLLGIVAAVECVRRMRAEGRPCPCPLHVIATNGEEGNDLGGTFGSRAMMGLLPLEDAEYLKKAASFGFSAEDLRAADLAAERPRCYLELHIEQGKTLTESGDRIGIVTGIVGLRRFLVHVEGEANHAGTTMMEYRRDALVGAARLITETDRLARALGHSMVATMGKLKVTPNVTAVVPGSVEMVLEIRNRDEALMDRFMSGLCAYAKTLEPEVRCSFDPLVKKQPVQCEPGLGSLTESVCRKLGFSFRYMPSGATHDGNAFAARMPIGMIFVPSVGGVSHSPKERTEWGDADAGMEVLYGLLCRLEEA